MMCSLDKRRRRRQVSRSAMDAWRWRWGREELVASAVSVSPATKASRQAPPNITNRPVCKGRREGPLSSLG